MYRSGGCGVIRSRGSVRAGNSIVDVQVVVDSRLLETSVLSDRGHQYGDDRGDLFSRKNIKIRYKFFYNFVSRALSFMEENVKKLSRSTPDALWQIATEIFATRISQRQGKVDNFVVRRGGHSSRRFFAKSSKHDHADRRRGMNNGAESPTQRLFENNFHIRIHMLRAGKNHNVEHIISWSCLHLNFANNSAGSCAVTAGDHIESESGPVCIEMEMFIRLRFSTV